MVLYNSFIHSLRIKESKIPLIGQIIKLNKKDASKQRLVILFGLLSWSYVSKCVFDMYLKTEHS